MLSPHRNPDVNSKLASIYLPYITPKQRKGCNRRLRIYLGIERQSSSGLTRHTGLRQIYLLRESKNLIEWI